jgi:hypothetical protein
VSFQISHQAINKWTEGTGLVLQASPNGSGNIETATAVLEDNPRDFPNRHPGVSCREPLLKKAEGISRRINQNIMLPLKPLDERTDPGGVASPLTA